jgi:hypothetical protein
MHDLFNFISIGYISIPDLGHHQAKIIHFVCIIKKNTPEIKQQKHKH